MPLAAGTALGPYEIVSPLGAGGMGEVYRARDRRLDRFVAVKVLPEHLAHDPDLRERFDREARAVSSLNHPHICTLHDIGVQDGVSFLVMELLEGETLADRLAKGRLPLDEALRYGVQIADALDKAHRQGVVHRDLKPGNVMLTRAGAKLLDFGLAKASRPAIVSSPQTRPSMTATPTISAPLTQQGSILGTLQYMSPEQLEGRDADARSDIFAFGAMLYEMVSGRRAFDGKSQVSILAAIVDHDPPPLSSLQPVTPPLLDHLVKTCLAKDPDARWQTIGDVATQLKFIAEAGLATPAATPGRAALRRWVWAATVAAFAVLSATLATVLLLREAPGQTQKVAFELNAGTSPSPLHLALSPDGRRLVSLLQTDKGVGVAVRALDQVATQIVPGTIGPPGIRTSGFPFWSPDGRWIAFFSGGKLKKVSLEGAPPQTLCDAPYGHGGTWNRSGVILFAPDQNGPLYQVSAAGGTPTQVTDLDGALAETAHRHPVFLPDGRHFLFIAVSSKSENSAIVLATLGSKERKRLLASSTKPGFAPPDHLLFLRETTLMTQRLDVSRFELAGEAVPVAEDVGANISNSAAGFTTSDNGVLAWRSGGAVGGETELFWVDRSGKPGESISEKSVYRNPALSPDSRYVAVDKRETANSGDIWILDLLRGTNTRFTLDPQDDDVPVWSPDGTRLVFASNRDGGHVNLYEKDAGGAGQERLLLKVDRPRLAPDDWSADGRYLLISDIDRGTSDLWVLPMAGERKLQPYLHSPYMEVQGRFSPNGRWVAYVSDENGRYEVYVQSFPASGTKVQVSTNGGVQPRWRRDGKELYFLAGVAAGDAIVTAVDVAESGTALRIGAQRSLFTTLIQSRIRDRNSWDVAPDGQRFLINGPKSSDATTAQRPITIVVNWMHGIVSGR